MRNCVNKCFSLVPRYETLKNFVVADDILILAVVGVALAKLHGQATQPVLMVAPQRDGPGESEMVGLFADIRQCNICTEGLNHVGVALRLNYRVRERLWMPPGIR